MNPLGVAEYTDVFGWISIHHHEIGELARLQSSDQMSKAQGFCPAGSRSHQSICRFHTCLDHGLKLARCLALRPRIETHCNGRSRIDGCLQCLGSLVDVEMTSFHQMR